MGGLEVREVPASDALAMARVAELGFGVIATDEEVAATATEIFDPEWSIGVYDEGQLVATASASNLELTLPAGRGNVYPVATVPGVTGVRYCPPTVGGACSAA